jgi:integrase
MARKEDRSNRWIKSERVGEVTLFLSPRSPYWQMYWTTEQSQATGNGVRRRRSRKIHRESTRETDLAFARLVAGRKSEELFKCRHYPDREREQKRTRMEPVIDDFLKYIETLGRTHDYLSKLKGRLRCLREWMEKRKLHFVQDIDPPLLRSFQEYLRTKRRCSAATANHYLDAIHNFFGFVIFKRRLMPGPNPAATGRQAELDRLPHQVLSPPTIYPDQINAVIAVAVRHFDSQIVNIILFICEGGFRFQELQFLQVGDINLEEREIILDIKKPDLERVRPELRRRCLTADGLWIPKSRAARRPIHITDRLARVVGSMGLGRGIRLGIHERGRPAGGREQDTSAAQALRDGGRRPGREAPAYRQAMVHAEVALAAPLPSDACPRVPDSAGGLQGGHGPRSGCDPRPLPWPGPLRVPRRVRQVRQRNRRHAAQPEGRHAMSEALRTHCAHRFSDAQVMMRQEVSNWRRGESNPRPEAFQLGRLRA